MYTINKQPSEVFLGVGIDFSARLDSGETLASAVVRSDLVSGMEGTGNDLYVADHTTSPSTGTVTVTVGGGYGGCTYKITYTVTGSRGSVLESEIKVKVKDL